MSTKQHTGSCLCGQVQFAIEGTFESFYLCHCERCQKDTGSAHAATLFSTNAQVSWISGSGNVQVFQLPTTRHMKSFCKTCGSALPTVQMGGKLLVVPAGSLDSSVDIRPTAHIYCSSKANWETELEEVPEYPGLPT